ncbi:MAG: thioredoxin [Gammaproteobacteria bacterium]|nr:thioredoxin [Gammaproteobacteria bacterium]MDH3767587.1 thioredoxin [Gammaproteobacteria bacterium]
MTDKALAVTDATFRSEVLEADKPVLVDFWAEWCGPCRALGPVIDELAGEQAADVKVVKVNVDDNPDVAREYAIRSIPTVLLIQAGQVRESFVGVQPKGVYLEAIQSDA